MPYHDTVHGRWSWYGNRGARKRSETNANLSRTKDAFVLGRLLAHPLTSLDSLPAALKAYQDVRLSVTQLVARESYRAGCLLQFSMHGHYDGTDRGNEREGLEILKELITRQHDNDGKGGVIAEWLEAEKKLRASAGLCNDCC